MAADSRRGPHCLGCDYSLRGLTQSRCPECGRPFHWDDRRSYRLRGPLPDLARQAFTPPGRVLNGVAIAAILYQLWQARLPGGHSPDGLSIVVLIVVVSAWIIRAGAMAIFAMIHRELPLRTRAAWVSWLLLPVCTAAGALVLQTGAPLNLGFLLSRSALDHAARSARAGHEPPGGWYGVYLVDEVTLQQGAVLFRIEHGHWNSYFAHSSGHPRPLHLTFQIEGDWYGAAE